MNIDLKHDLLKNFICKNQLGNKTINTTIDQSMVASTEQKSLGMDSKTEDKKELEKRKKEKKKKRRKKI